MPRPRATAAHAARAAVVAGVLIGCIPGISGPTLELEIVNDSGAPVTVDVLHGRSSRRDVVLREVVEPGERRRLSAKPGSDGWTLLVDDSVAAYGSESPPMETFTVLVDANGHATVSNP